MSLCFFFRYVVSELLHLFSKQVGQFFPKCVLQWDLLPAGLQAAGRFFEHQLDLIEGDAAFLVQVEGVQDAIEGLEAPGMGSLSSAAV